MIECLDLKPPKFVRAVRIPGFVHVPGARSSTQYRQVSCAEICQSLLPMHETDWSVRCQKIETVTFTLQLGWVSATSIAQEAVPYPQSNTSLSLASGGKMSLPSKTIFKIWCWSVSRSISSCWSLSLIPVLVENWQCSCPPHPLVPCEQNCRLSISGSLAHGWW